MRKLFYTKKKRNTNDKNNQYVLTEEKELQTESNNIKEIKPINTTTNISKQIYQREIENNSNNNKKNIVLNMGDFIQDFPERIIVNEIQKKRKKAISIFLFLVSFLFTTVFFCFSYRLCEKNIPLNKCILKLNISYFTELNIRCLSCAVIINMLLALIISRIAPFYYLVFIFLQFGLLYLINHNNDIYTNGLYFIKKLIYYIIFSFVVIIIILFIFTYVLLGKYFLRILFFFFA